MFLIIIGFNHPALFGQTPESFTEAEIAWLNEHQKLRLGVDPDWPPFEFVEAGNSYRGMCSEVVKILSQQLNIQMEILPNLLWNEVIQKAKSRELDILPCAMETPERLKFLNFTRPHLSFPIVIITRDNAPFISGLHDLYEQKVAVVNNYATHDLLKREYPDIELMLPNNALDALHLVSTGQADAFVDNLVTVSYLIKKHFFANLKVAAPTSHKFALSFGVRKDWPLLVNILDKQLSMTTQAEYNTIYQKWISIRYEHGINMAEIWRISFKIGIGIFIILAFILYWNRRLTKEIVKRKEAEAELRKLSRAVEQSPTIMLITNLEGTIEFVNPAFSKITGYSYEEAVGRNPRFLQSGRQSAKFYTKLWNTILKGQVWHGEFINKRKNGQLFSELTTISSVCDQAGNITHYLALAEDITRRKQTEKSLRMEEVKNKKLQQLDKLKDEFLANTSHELRTPLNGIIGIAESLIDGAGGPLSETLHKNLLMISQSGYRLTNLVNDILDFSKLKHKDIELQLRPVSLREIIEIVLTLSQPLIGAKNLQLINAIESDLPAALADENRIQQILYNLIGNAIKFTESGQIKIAAQTFSSGEGIQSEQSVSSSEKEVQENISYLIITISDTGIGIPKDKLIHIFEAFEQAEGSTARNYGGTGLGLAVTKKLVELHQGRIWVESEPGVGSQFKFSLPISIKPAESLLQKSSLLTKITPANISHQPNSQLTLDAAKGEFKILIVDDEPINIQVLLNHLSLQNYTIIEASSGIEACELIKNGVKPDLILLDVMMPHMTGYEVVQEIRQAFPINELPILMLTAKNQLSDLITGLEAGANDYLTKPISKHELLARVKMHLNLHHLNTAYSRFVPHEFLKFLNKDSIVDIQLGDHIEKEMTILFSDIRDFTSISEKMTPSDNFNFINAYLKQMVPVIEQYNGFIDKYIGDAIMALFSNADDAVQASLVMLKSLATYNLTRGRSERPVLNIGIGLNSGQLMLGTVGNPKRMDGTVISDAVNLASRIEGLTKNYHTPLLITEKTYRQLTDPAQYKIRVIDRVTVKGKNELVTIYEVFDQQESLQVELKSSTLADFEQGFHAFHQGQFEQAQTAFEKVLQINNDDNVAQIYADNCRKVLGIIMPKQPIILIVDDEPNNIKILFNFLKTHDFEILIAEDGEAALDVVLWENPHLILLDIMMPGIDGFEVCQQLKKNPKTQNIPIIFTTALSTTTDKIKGFQSGAVDYITKPFQVEEVLSRIKIHLALSFLQQQSQAKNVELEIQNVQLKDKINTLATPFDIKQKPKI